ncbi:MAG: UDP-N-acetylmuramate--L-alanine ligase [Oscillospiraceae bacterium]|nr:UDP-N-acetylmuramate--L-alanine ligase [Oscillospiraceae bacterium]
MSFEDFLTRGRLGHLIGIGGVSMSPLGEVLSGMGLNIRGSDTRDSVNVEHLRALGIQIAIGHAAENIAPDTDFVVRTAAVHDDNVEVMEARRRGIPVFERSEAWGAIMKDYKNALCISGTHGKTTTTSMSTHIMMAAQRDPTVMIGGTLPLLHAGHRVGKGDTIILESCEYYNSFLKFSPTVAVILNIDNDHLDFFKDIDDIKKSFRAFAELVPPTGLVVANMDDANTMDALFGISRSVVTFGLTDAADFWARNIRFVGATSEFDIMYQGRKFTHVSLRVPGMHNVKNALAATAACVSLGAGPLAVKYGLSAFKGAGRRFEFKGKFNGADVYDDYAHHPGELRALLDAVEQLGYSRVVLAFQPHTYSRTKALFNDFLTQLKRPQLAVIGEIYSARETNTDGISSRDLVNQVPNAIYAPDLESLEQTLRAIAAPGDIILTVGAGDIYRVGERLAGEK